MQISIALQETVRFKILKRVQNLCTNMEGFCRASHIYAVFAYYTWCNHIHVLSTHTGMHTTSKGSILSLSLPHRYDVIISNNDMEGTFPLHEGIVCH